jgi:hypothetical protein
MRRYGFSVTLFLGLSILAGCASPYRMPPDHEARFRAIKTVALLPPEAKVYSLPAVGRPQMVEEWSKAARKNLARAIGRHAGTHGRFLLKEFNPADSLAAEQAYSEVRPRLAALLSRISDDYRRSMEKWGKDPWDAVEAPFVYSLGPVPALGNGAEADALLFTFAADQISTAGRKAGIILGGILGGLAAGVGSLGGGASVPVGGGGGPGGGATTVRMVLVDSRTGDVLWSYGWAKSGDFNVYDLRDPASADKAVGIAFDHFRKAAASGKPKGE